MRIFNVSLIALALSLSACGTTGGDRALSGGAIGAGAGAAVGAVTGMGIGTGALVGGAVGAGAGALTDENDIDLGKPIWR
jgi:osmotically inducible lipoprotein OsmB